MKKLTLLFLLVLAALALAKDYKAPSKDFVKIKGGTFFMGSPESEDWRSKDEVRHSVTVNDFYMSRFEVTQKLYRDVMGKNPSYFKGDDLPVENMTWLEAVLFCNALSLKEKRTPVYSINESGTEVIWNRAADGYRLPTEAEWEYASRGGTQMPFSTAKYPGADDANFYGHYPYQIEQNYFNDEVLETRPGLYRGKTLKVGSFKPNPFGLYDMHGNVNEWCFDFYGDYDKNKSDNPFGAVSGTRRVNRGGGWNDFGKNLRCAYRGATPQNNKSFNLGIRLVVNASDKVKGDVLTNEIKTAENSAGKNGPTANEKTAQNKTLIVYYSWGGNTQGVAREIKKQTGADIVELKLEKPYSDDYNTVLNEAQRDQRRQARPKLKNKIQNMDSYSTIILGYPNWWASIPMPIATFLESYDLSGKTIMPFCSHGGGRFGQSLTAIAKLAPNSTITEGLSIHYSGGSSLKNDVSKWLKKLGR